MKHPLCWLLASVIGVLVLTAGCASEDPRSNLRAWIRTEIDDEARGAKLTALVEERSRYTNDYAEETARYRKELRRLNADYDATPDQFSGLRTEFAAVREAQRKRLITTAMEMRKLCTADEWAELAELDQQAAIASLNQAEESR